MSGFLLDTNIPSELLRPRPDSKVAAWVERQGTKTLFISVVSLGELCRGAVLLPHGSRRALLEHAIQVEVPEWFNGRILPVTRLIAERWGEMDGRRQLAGRPLHVADGLIAATALEHGLTLVTRNTKDFEGLGVTILNPWESA